MTSDLRLSLASLVASVACPSIDPSSVTDATVLLRGGLDLDSLSLLELVVGLEKAGIEVPAADVVAANFRTFASFHDYVLARRDSKRSSSPAPRPQG